MSAHLFTSLFVIVAVAGNDLGHRDYRRRDSAGKLLSEMMPLSRSVLLRLSKSPDYEIAFRSKRIVRCWWTIQARADRIAAHWLHENQKLPWLWLGRYCWSFHVTTACYKHGFENKFPEYPAWRQATYFWIISELKGGQSNLTIFRRLRDMRRAEKEWCKQHR